MRSHLNHLLPRIIRKSRHSPCRDKVVAVGLNQKHVPIMIKTNLPRFYLPGGGWHAEERVIHSVPTKLLRYILLARVSRSGRLLPIDPCDRCVRLARKFDVKIVAAKSQQLRLNGDSQ